MAYVRMRHPSGGTGWTTETLLANYWGPRGWVADEDPSPAPAVQLGGRQLKGLQDPTDPDDAATMSWVEAAIALIPGGPGGGGDGQDGREVELQNSGGFIRWRYAGEATWTNLVALSALTGPQGIQGIQGVKGDTGSAGAPGTPGSPGTAGLDGADGVDGTDGREVELSTSATHIRWRYAGTVPWTDLVTLASLKGADGAPGAAGSDGADGAPGSAGADGDDGRAVQLQTTGTHIQWRYAGDASWTNLVALATLKGADGAPGTPGTPGAAGADGADGADGWHPLFVASLDDVPPGTPADRVVVVR